MGLSTGSKSFLAVVAAVGLAVGVGLGVWNVSSPAGRDAGEPVVVEIPEGTGASAVGDLLADRGVIRSATAFRLVARFDERSSRIRAGTYQLRAGMSADEVLTELTRVPEEAETFRVTVPEGLTVDQTLEQLAGADGSPHSVEQLREALAGVALPAWVPVDGLPDDAEPFEGLLFPSTYDFRVSADPQEVLGRLVAETDRVMAGVEPPGELGRYELLTVASLIEREARVADEQRLISAVIHNRLARPMRLQVDATVLYALGGHKDRVLYEDLEVDSPWNTYRFDGLPPTPISGAGEAAIRAAAEPEDVDYLYYVVIDPDTGEHAFALTHEEHQRNVQQARSAQ